LFVITLKNYVVKITLGSKITDIFVRFKREFVMTVVVITEVIVTEFVAEPWLKPNYSSNPTKLFSS
jgi:hypothetical protein